MTSVSDLLLLLFALAAGVFCGFIIGQLKGELEITRDSWEKCNQFLVNTNAPRNDKCEIVVSYKIIKGEQK